VKDLTRPPGRDLVRTRLVEVAAHLLATDGPDAVTTRSVALAAGVQAPSIYRPYENDPAYEGVPPVPEPVAPPGLEVTDRVGDWTLREACR